MKFAVEQRMGSAVMPLQEVRIWPESQGVLSGYELCTDIWTLLLPNRGILHVSFVKKSYRKKVHFCCFVRHCLGGLSIFLVTVMSPKMICGRCWKRRRMLSSIFAVVITPPEM